MARSYYREAAAAVVVFDVSDERSFQQLPQWLAAAREHTRNPELTVALVGNKVDARRAVPRDAAEAFARENNLLFCETSAKTGEGVEQLFKSLSSAIMRKVEQGVLAVDEPWSGVKRADRRVVAPTATGAPDAAGGGVRIAASVSLPASAGAGAGAGASRTSKAGGLSEWWCT